MRFVSSSWLNPTKFVGAGAIAGALLSLVLFETSASADAAACKGLADAMLANTKTPYHSISMVTFDPAAGAEKAGNPNPSMSQTSETIFTGKAIFVRFGSGGWQEVHASLDKLAELVRRSAESFTDCQRLPGEAADGATLSVYAGHSVTDKFIVETKVWVTPDRGVMIRSETDIVSAPTSDNSDANVTARHEVIHYDYKDITPPPMAQ